MRILITGASGYLGRHLIPNLLSKGFEVYALYRKISNILAGVIPLKGDIGLPNLGLEEVPKIDRLYHLAGLISFSEKDREEVWDTNFRGTVNVVTFCRRNNIPHIFYVSTAYVCGDYKGVYRESDRFVGQKFKNTYEESKYLAESAVYYSPLKRTILRPGILIHPPCQAKPHHTVPRSNSLYHASGFHTVVRAIVKIHIPMERLRLILEEKLKLPPIRPLFRIEGEEEATLNIIPVDWVAKKIAEIENEGIFHLTNPKPPKLKDLALWVGDILKLNIKFEREFKKSLVENIFHRYSRPYLEYLKGEPLFESSVNSDCPLVDEGFVKRSVLEDLRINLI